MKTKARALTVGFGANMKEHMTAIRKMNGGEQLTAGAELLAEELQLMEILQAHNLELRGMLGLKSRPWVEYRGIN